MSTVQGIITKPSAYPVAETLTRLENILKQKGIHVFARVDHSGEARKAGLQMHDTELLIFGNPKAGTPAMVAAPLTAIDLPLKALSWQDADGKVWLSYNDPAYLGERFGLKPDLLTGIAAAGALIEQAAK